MTTTATGTATATNPALAALNAPSKLSSISSGLGALDQGDFLKLLTTQLQQQDPLEPVDNKDMLAQMAQFSALAGSTKANATLADISAKMDDLIAAQQAAAKTTTPTPTA